MARSRRERVAIGFMIFWLVLWTAAILVVLWLLGGALVSGELGAAPFLLVWLAAAGFGLRAGLRKLRSLVTGERAPPRLSRKHVWKDDLFNRTDR